MQTAEKYADTVIGLLKSSDIQKQALDALPIPATTANLTALDKSLVVRRTGPQLVFVSVTGKSSDYTVSMWKALSSAVIERAASLNQNGDSKLFIEVVEKEPVVTEVAKKPWVYGLGGFALGAFIVIFVLSVREFLKGK